MTERGDGNTGPTTSHNGDSMGGGSDHNDDDTDGRSIGMALGDSRTSRNRGSRPLDRRSSRPGPTHHNNRDNDSTPARSVVAAARRASNS